MNQPHYLDTTGKCLREGNRAERRFAEIAKKNDLNIHWSGFDDDAKKHFDITLENKRGDKRKVDIKAMKTICRGANSFIQDKYIWLELWGVNKGNRGWIFGGKSHYIAFETEKGFLLVPRQKLVKFAQDIIDSKPERVDWNDGENVKPKEGKYIIYSRRLRLDKLVLVERKDIEKLATRKLNEK